jgi:hypothetical protein
MWTVVADRGGIAVYFCFRCRVQVERAQRAADGVVIEARARTSEPLCPGYRGCPTSRSAWTSWWPGWWRSAPERRGHPAVPPAGRPPGPPAHLSRGSPASRTAALARPMTVMAERRGSSLAIRAAETFTSAPGRRARPGGRPSAARAAATSSGVTVPGAARRVDRPSPGGYRPHRRPPSPRRPRSGAAHPTARGGRVDGAYRQLGGEPRERFGPAGHQHQIDVAPGQRAGESGADALEGAGPPPPKAP